LWFIVLHKFHVTTLKIMSFVVIVIVYKCNHIKFVQTNNDDYHLNIQNAHNINNYLLMVYSHDSRG